MAKKMGKYERARALVELEKQLDKIFVAKGVEILNGFTYNDNDPVDIKNFVKGLRKITENAIARRVEHFEEKAQRYINGEEWSADEWKKTAATESNGEVTDNE